MLNPASKFLLVSTLAAGLTGLDGVRVKAAVFKEVAGQVVIEAEHFDFRTNQVNGPHHWAIIPDEETGAPPFLNARGSYLQILPDAGENKSTAEDVVGTPPYIEYKFLITTVGQYQLYLRHVGWDGGSDSAYAQIRELLTTAVPPGPGPDWYRYSPNPTVADFDPLQNDPNDAATANQGWSGFAAPAPTISGDGSEEPALWTISAPGTYTLRFSQREDGTALDALILQLATLPAPINPGPAESDLVSGLIIATQPRDVTVANGQTATFTVAAKSGVPPTYQWQKAAAGSANFTDITGAVTASYTTSAQTSADDGTQYRCVVSIPGTSATSRAAKVTVDVTSPTVVRAAGSSSFTQATIFFSEPVDPASATNAANYSIGGLTISGAARSSDGTSVTLTTSTQTTNASYTAAVNNVKDLVGNTLSPNPSQVTFHGWILATGGILHRYWENINGNTIANLTNNSRFPNNPSFTTIEPAFEYPPNGGGEAGSNYGNQLTGFLTAPATGNYIFFTCSDDPSSLFLSTDENPANKKLIAVEASWSNARNWNTPGGGTSAAADKRSDQYTGSEWSPPNTITLTANKRYYIEVLHTEGGGGDNVGVAWTLPGGTDPADGDPPIPGSALSYYYNPDGTVTITQQPQSLTLAANSPAAFSVVATGASDFGTTIRYQWQKAPSGSSSFTDVAGATQSQYTIPFVASSDNGTQFRAVLSVLPAGVPFDYSRTTSSVATLTVTTDNAPPTVAGAIATVQTVRISFSEPLDQASATTTANYSIGQGVTINSATVVSAADAAAIVQLAVSGAAAGQSYTVTINNVKDRANNAIAPNSTASFVVYQAYYDFNDGQVPAGTTVGGVATVLPTGGITGSGLLQLTPALGSMQGGFLIPDLVNGATVTNLTVTFKLFIGQGSGNPADGFSFNFGTDLAGIDNTSEEGSGNGLIIALDTYDNGGGEAPAIGVKFGGTEFATTNLAKATLVNNQWVDVTIRLNGDGTLDVVHNGTTYFNKLSLTAQGYTPMAGATFLLGARTGGEWEVHWVDNLAILVNATAQVPPMQPRITSATLSGGMISIQWTNGGTLESTPSLSTSPITWTSTGNSSGTFSEPATGTKFYRVKQ